MSDVLRAVAEYLGSYVTLEFMPEGEFVELDEKGREELAGHPASIQILYPVFQSGSLDRVGLRVGATVCYHHPHQDRVIVTRSSFMGIGGGTLYVDMADPGSFELIRDFVNV